MLVKAVQIVEIRFSGTLTKRAKALELSDLLESKENKLQCNATNNALDAINPKAIFDISSAF